MISFEIEAEKDGSGCRLGGADWDVEQQAHDRAVVTAEKIDLNFAADGSAFAGVIFFRDRSPCHAGRPSYGCTSIDFLFKELH